MSNMKGFKKFGGEYVEDLGKYLRDYLKNNKNVKIYVGCDSEQYKKYTRYATVVVMYHKNNGAHFIFKDERVERVKDMYTKLFNEVEKVFAVGEYLEVELEGHYPRLEPLKKLVDLDIDLNPDPKWKSNMVHAAGLGYLTAAGYRTRCKPFAWAASCAADLCCRKKRRKSKKF